MDGTISEYKESTTVTFEWTLRGLKSLFESSKGESKSKVTKSVRFGGGRWQILFYANSGTSSNAEGQGFVSLYLSCEPTADERESAVNGKWVREGLYRFSFELRNLQKTILFNTKEAHDHSFSHRTQNWGWAQFARRDTIYYKPTSVWQQDAFLIICTISSSPTSPIPPPAIPRQLVPKELLDAMGSLLDDPAYSDVEFVLPRRGRGSRGARRIYAARSLLKRVDYFDAMFSSGFSEASEDQPSLDSGNMSGLDADAADETSSNATGGLSLSLMRQFEDSDDEDDDEDYMAVTPDDVSELRYPQSSTTIEETRPSSTETATSDTLGSWTSVINATEESVDPDELLLPQRNVRAKLSHPSTPRARDLDLEPDNAENRTPDADSLLPHLDQTYTSPSGISPAPTSSGKVQVVIRDVAYATYRAVLYYIYTDTIVFAPLSSSFFPASMTAPLPSTLPSTPTVTASETQHSLSLGPRSNQQQEVGGAAFGPSPSSTVPATRRAWIAQWERNNPGKPRPSSAKAVYRLADKLDLQELKERAFKHIIKSLTVHNVAYEVFSTFSAAFEDVRKVQVRFFLDNWIDIRASESMLNVWQQIRLGRHPGFEEVWPVIAENLEFKSRTADASGDGKEVTAGLS